MSRYYQLIVFLTVYCIKNNCDQTEPSFGHQFKCKNDVCSEKIGLVEASQNYLPDNVYKLKFNNGDKIDIFGITVDDQYYLAKLGNRQGLISKKLVRVLKQSHKDDDLMSTYLDDSWKLIGELNEGDSIVQSSTSSVDGEISSNSADDLSVSTSDEDDKPKSQSPIDKLETSFQPNNNQEEPTSSLNFQNDQIKTSESPIVVPSEQITKSQPEQAYLNIAPSSPSVPSDPPSIAKATTEVAGTTFALDAFDDQDLLGHMSDEISLQSSTPTPIMDNKPPPPPPFVFSGINDAIETSNLSPSSIESPPEKSLEMNPSASVEMPQMSENAETDHAKVSLSEENPKIEDDGSMNKLDKPMDSAFTDHGSNSDKTSPESPPSTIDEKALSTPSPFPSILNDVDNTAARETPLQSESSSDENKRETGFTDNFNNQPSETSTQATELSSSSITVEQVTGSQNGFTSNSVKSDQFINKNNYKLDLNIDEPNESIPLSQVQNKEHSSLLSSDTTQNFKSNENIDGHQTNQGNLLQSNQEKTKHESYVDKGLTNDGGYQTFESGVTEATNQQINDGPSTYLPSAAPPPVQQLPPPVHQHKPLFHQNHHNYHQHVHEQQQYRKPEQQQQPPIISTNYDHKYNIQPSDEMTRQMAVDLEKKSSPFPSSSSYLSTPSPLEEPITSDISLSSSSSQLETESVNHQNFDSNLALPTQSSLHSNSASPSSDQQSTFNSGGGDKDSLTDAFTQTTFTETPIASNYPDAMRSQIALLTTLLPEPMLDYLHHINFSPSIFVILLMITITWLVMFITSKVLSSHKEKITLEDQLCRNHGENFNLKTERDYLFDELAAEKEKNSRLLKEHLEMKDKFENINHHVEHSESVQSDLIIKLESLEDETRKQKQKIEQLEKNNETLKMESDDAKSDLKKVKSDLDKLSKDLEVKTDALESAEMEIEKYVQLNEKLEVELNSLKTKEEQLQNDLKRLTEYEETIEKLKTELEEREQEISSMKLFIEDYHHNTNESPGYSLESLLDGIKMKAELNVAQNQLKSIKEEKDSLSSKLSEIESRVSKAEADSSEAMKAKDEAERRLQILKTYFNEQEVKLQSELGTWKLKYEEILARNESVPGYIEDLKRSNEAFKMQIETLEREIAKREEKHRVDCSKLERDKHELYMSKIRVVDDLKNLKSECEILRKKLTLKSKGYSDDDVKHSMDGPSSLNFDSLPPPPPPTSYLEDTLDSSGVGSGPWSLNAIESPPPPFPVAWMNSSDSTTSGYSSLPPAPLPLQQQQQHQPPSNHYPSHHHPHPHYPAPVPAPPIPSVRDNYSPTSQRSHDQRSVRSDISFSSTNNSHHHYSNYGPPPPLHPTPQTVQGPFSNPIPSHWSVNTQHQQQQHQQQQSQSSSHNESITNYNDRNYYTGGR